MAKRKVSVLAQLAPHMQGGMPMKKRMSDPPAAKKGKKKSGRK